jgi:Putative adhesin
VTTIVAPPPVNPPPQLSPGGRTAFRVALIATASLLLAGTVAALGVAAWGVSTVRVITDHQTLPATMRSLVIDTAHIPVAIRIVADRETREAGADLRLVNTTHSGEHRLQVTTDGNEARIVIAGNPSPVLEWARGGEITVAVPPEQARRLTVRTEQEIGMVISQADVDQLIARTTDGAIILRGGARRVEAHTVSGEIVSRDPIAVTEQFSATTSDGDIAVDFRDTAPRRIDAVSRSSDVVIGLPERGPYLVHAQSGSSTQVRVPETTDPDAAVAEVTVRSDDGDVVVENVGPGH